jgi:hypothetical protein
MFLLVIISFADLIMAMMQKKKNHIAFDEKKAKKKTSDK